MRSIEGATDAIPRINRAERLGQLTGVGTLITGLVLMFLVGPDTVSAGVWVGLALVLTAIAVGATMARPASNRLRAAVGEGDLATAKSVAQRISGVLAVESLLWSAALVAMLV